MILPWTIDREFVSHAGQVIRVLQREVETTEASILAELEPFQSMPSKITTARFVLWGITADVRYNHGHLRLGIRVDDENGINQFIHVGPMTRATLMVLRVEESLDTLALLIESPKNFLRMRIGGFDLETIVGGLRHLPGIQAPCTPFAQVAIQTSAPP